MNVFPLVLGIVILFIVYVVYKVVKETLKLLCIICRKVTEHVLSGRNRTCQECGRTERLP